MAEITKITTPMMPKENVGNKYKPITDQAFELTDPSKVHKSQEDGRVSDQQRQPQTGLGLNMGRAAMEPLLKDTIDLMHILQKMVSMAQTGISTSEAMQTDELRAALQSLFVPSSQVAGLIQEQADSAVLFKGEAFDALRDILAKFPDNRGLRESVAGVLKAFEQNLSSEKSVQTILANCYNLLDYMFAKDREQFGAYLNGLARILLPEQEEGQAPPRPEGQETMGGEAPRGAADVPQGAPGQPVRPEDTAQADPARPLDQPEDAPPSGRAPEASRDDAHTPETSREAATPRDGATARPSESPRDAESARPPEMSRNPGAARQPGAARAAFSSAPMSDQREAVGILKNNLLPLLGEIVGKYNQNAAIRDTVMVVVHNIVRVDQGTPETLERAVNDLVRELKQVANLPPGFERKMVDSLMEAREKVPHLPNSTVEKMVEIISDTLSSPSASPPELRQAELLLLSLLQNQSSLMNVLHFVMPILAPDGSHVVAELYVDPDSEEKSRKGSDERSNKVFMSFDSEHHGSFEMAFVQTGEYVDMNLWCPPALVKAMQEQRRQFADMMMARGYTMTRFEVGDFIEPHSIGEVFPALLRQKVGMDVSI